MNKLLDKKTCFSLFLFLFLFGLVHEQFFEGTLADGEESCLFCQVIYTGIEAALPPLINYLFSELPVLFIQTQEFETLPEYRIYNSPKRAPPSL